MKTVWVGAEAAAPEVRGLITPPPDVEDEVGKILEEVRGGGDAAVLRLTARFDRADVAPS